MNSGGRAFPNIKATLVLVVTAIASRYLLNYVRALSALHDCIWAAFFAANIHFTDVAREAGIEWTPQNGEEAGHFHVYAGRFKAGLVENFSQSREDAKAVAKILW